MKMDERMQAIFQEFQQQIGALAASAVSRCAQLAGEVAALTTINRKLQIEIEELKAKIADADKTIP